MEVIMAERLQIRDLCPKLSGNRKDTITKNSRSLIF